MQLYTTEEADALLGHRFCHYQGYAYMGHPEKVLHIVVGDHQFVPATNLPLDTVECLRGHDPDLDESVEMRLEPQSQLRCVASEIRYVHNGIVRRLREENAALGTRVHKLEAEHQELEFALGNLRMNFENLLSDYRSGKIDDGAYDTFLTETETETEAPTEHNLSEMLSRCANEYADMQARCAIAERDAQDTRDLEDLRAERRQDALVLLHKACKALDFMLPSAKMLTEDLDTAVSSYAKHNVLVYASVLESIHGALDAFSNEYNNY